MAFDWFEFFRLAEDLAARGDEAAKRTAISRAYYFIFHLCYVRVVRNCGVKPVNATTHAWCWQQFTNTVDPACSVLGPEGERLKRLRHTADYDSNDIPRLDRVCERMLGDVQQFHADFLALDVRLPSP